MYLNKIMVFLGKWMDQNSIVNTNQDNLSSEWKMACYLSHEDPSL